MRPIHTLFALPALCSCLLLAGRPLPAGEPQAAGEAEERFVVRVYPLGDLLVPWPQQYPYSGSGLPATGPVGSVSAGGSGTSGFGVGGGMMGGMGGMGMGGMGMGGTGGGGGGGGMFNVASDTDPQAPAANSPALPSAASGDAGSAQLGGVGGRIAVGRSPQGGRSAGVPRFSGEELVGAIQSVIEPQSWDNMGGPGSLVLLDNLMVVRQTEAVQEQVAKLLRTIASDVGDLPCVRVVAFWLMLDTEQLAELSPATRPGAGAKAQDTVDPQVLERLAGNVPGYRGQIVCFDGQTVHVVAGSRRSVVTGVIPVVGGGVGYQPLSAYPNIGVLLQVTPYLLRAKQAAVLDVQSIVTHWYRPEEPLTITSRSEPQTDPTGQHLPATSSTVSVDRANIGVHQFATTLRVPLGKPVLVAGLDFPSDSQPGLQPGETGQLYLIVEVSVSGGEHPEGGKQ